MAPIDYGMLAAGVLLGIIIGMWITLIVDTHFANKRRRRYAFGPITSRDREVLAQWRSNRR